MYYSSASSHGRQVACPRASAAPPAARPRWPRRSRNPTFAGRGHHTADAQGLVAACATPEPAGRHEPRQPRHRAQRARDAAAV